MPRYLTIPIYRDKGQQMRNIIATLSLAALTGNAVAGWIVASDTDGHTRYVDVNTIRRSANTVKMWTLLDYKQPELDSNGKSYLSSVRISEYDCAERRTRVLQASRYQGKMRGGDMVSSTNHTFSWDYVEPGTVGETILEIACKKKQSNS